LDGEVRDNTADYLALLAWQEEQAKVEGKEDLSLSLSLVDRGRGHTAGHGHL
jgi:hypothetical protein